MMNEQMKYQRIVEAATENPWAILPAKLVVIRELLAYRAAGHKFTPEEIAERLGTIPRKSYLTLNQELDNEQIEKLKQEWEATYSGKPMAIVAAVGNGRSSQTGVAVLPLVGTIMPRGNMMLESSGAVSVQRFTQRFREAMSDPDVGHIIIDVDSPGGQVGGVSELANEIFAARGTKPVTAVSNGLAASAAYWLAAAAGELVITPSGEVGSIGVFAVHQDVSGWLANEGVSINLISAGKFKTEGNPYEPLTEEARGAIQGRVDEYYEMFTGDVARFRGVSIADVQSGFGEGRVVGAETAVSLGMADRVGTLDDVIGQSLVNLSVPTATANLEFRRRRLRAAGR